MRCIHLLDTNEFAGTERHVLLLAQQMRRQGADAVIGCRSGSPLEREAAARAIPTVNLGSRPGFGMLCALWRCVRRKEVDLIHAHNGRTLLIGAIVERLTGVPLFATQHFLEPQFTTYRGMKRALANAAHHWVNQSVSRFAAVSEAARVATLAREQIAPEQVVTIPNGVEPLPALSPERRLALRAELGADSDGPLIVTVARLVTEKGLGDLVATVPKVLQSIRNAKFVVVGDGPLARSLSELAAQLGVARSIRFAGFRPDATDIIATADLFVLPSPAEPFGLVLLEAMAMARTVIAVAAGGPLEIVADGRTGQLVPPSDPNALAKAIVELLMEPAKLESMGLAGQQRFTQLFTAERMAAATLALYADAHMTEPSVAAASA